MTAQLYYQTATKLHPCGAWMLSYTQTPARLTVTCDYPAVVAAGLDVALGHALWECDGTQYQTASIGVETAGALLVVQAVVVPVDHERMMRVLDRWVSNYLGEDER